MAAPAQTTAEGATSKGAAEPRSAAKVANGANPATSATSLSTATAAKPAVATAAKPAAATAAKPAAATAAKPAAATAAKPATAGKKKPAAGAPAKQAARKLAPAKTPVPAREKPLARLAGSVPGKPDASARQALSGHAREHSSEAVAESPELTEMREVDAMLFPRAAAMPFALELPAPVAAPAVNASGLPSRPTPPAPTPGARAATEAVGTPDRAWLAKLEMPEIPVRFDAGVVRYLEYYRDNPRGRRLVAAWLKKSGRYRGAMVKVLREHKLPEDLVWLALIESGFDPTVHSHAGAAGLWQFMPATGRIYGLTVNQRVDERLDPERSTIAAVTHLKDLYARFGTWELAFAAYNMGYGGLLASIRKYNTNDYWELRRLEAGLPYETALYVPKIVSMAIVARNCAVFGCDGVALDRPEPFGEVAADKVALAPGVTLDELAAAVRVTPEEIAALNPHVIGTRLPPLEQSATARTSWTAFVPEGKGPRAASLPSSGTTQKLRTHRVRWGESIAHIAARYHTSASMLEQLNDLDDDEAPRPGTAVFVPKGAAPASDAAALLLRADRRATDKAIVVVPDRQLEFAGRRRVFYQVVYGDTVEDIARVTEVSASELRRWNHLDARATLQAGMHVQLFVANDAAPADVLWLEESQVVPLTVVSEAFFSHFVGQSGRERVQVLAREGDTWQALAKRHNVTLGSLERINHKSRRSKLAAGDRIIVYAKRPASVRSEPEEPAVVRGVDATRTDEVERPPDAMPADAMPASPAVGGALPSDQATVPDGVGPALVPPAAQPRVR
ncbi:MAG: LysM peptidoglycan-binding domain-containing protein [Myxococcales bacterium]|nr:LysM peptidoglycan-binding domain-containing protein [Myxococcales bacterium]